MRVYLIVLDSVGAGELPDAAAYGDVGSNTLAHVITAEHPKLPNLEHMGLCAIDTMPCEPPADAVGAVGRAIETSPGKDTTTGHWEMAGIKLTKPFPTYPDGFPPDVIAAFEKAIGTKTLGNYAASGTVIIEDLGEEHLRTGYPIVYTSADSVFQIACNEEIIPVETLYEWCEAARGILCAATITSAALSPGLLSASIKAHSSAPAAAGISASCRRSQRSWTCWKKQGTLPWASARSRISSPTKA